MMEEFFPSATLPNIAWGAGGALGTVALSKLLLPQATGAMGFLRDAASVLGIGWVARQVGGKEAQTAALVGGGTILAAKLLNSLGVGRGLGLAEMADSDYGHGSLGAYYEDPTLDVPWQGTMNDLGAYYEDPSLGAYYEDPSLGYSAADAMESQRRIRAAGAWLAQGIRSGRLTQDQAQAIANRLTASAPLNELAAIEDYDDPGLFDLRDDDEMMEDYDDDEMMDDYDTDTLGDDDDMMEDYDPGSLGDDDDMGMF